MKEHMKEKTIKAVLRRKFNDWVDSIEDEGVKKAVKSDAIIAGGSIVSLLLNEKPNDYDVYFRTKATCKKVAQYYVQKWIEQHGEVENRIDYAVQPYVIDGEDVQAWINGRMDIRDFAPNYNSNIPPEQASGMITNTPADRIKIIFPSDGIWEEGEQEQGIDEYMEACEDLSEMDADMLEKEHPETEEKGKYRPVFLSTNAITLSNKIQIVIRFYGEPDKIFENYDFEHCKCYWDSRDNVLEIPQKSLMCIINKELFYSGSKYPVCSIIRTRKFLKRGWHINAGQYLKMCFQVSELDLTDINTLEDQLVGVDSLYFLQVVEVLRKQQEKNQNWRFDSTYLASVIDRIF